MCGIFVSTRAMSEVEIDERLDVIRHRGPDNSGSLIYDSVVLGHNRLSIVDLDERSNQPFVYGEISLVFNGEIYNHGELREVLIEKGYQFRTSSDTEVLAACYLEYGAECLSIINGMFAFVIFDRRSDELFGAVDRLGKKPLYYSGSGDFFEVASQTSQLSINAKLDVSTESVAAYFKYKYVPSPRSIFDGVSKLSAGSYFVYDLQRKRNSVYKYYDVREKRVRYTGEYREAVSELDDLLGSSIGLRLMADVPVGVFLSGGIDSSLVAAIGQKNSSERLNTFCVQFEDKKFDESRDAERVAAHIGTNHTTIECGPRDVIEAMSSYGRCYDEPFADSSALPSMLLCRVARQHVKVALSGDGADETFLGYNRYAVLEKVRHLYRAPLVLRRAGRLLPQAALSSKMKSAVRTIGLPNAADFYHAYMQGFDQGYFRGDPQLCLTQNKDYLAATSNIILNAGLYDTVTYLPDDINVKVDRASMFSSLELRAPFLDYRIVEFGLSLPQEFKLHRGRKKIILRELASQYLPSSIVEKRKSGFSLPIGEWFRSEMKEFVMDNLSFDNLKRIPNIDPKLATDLINLHMARKANKQSEIFKLLAYVLWMQHWT